MAKATLERVVAGHRDTSTTPDAQLMAEMHSSDGDALRALFGRYSRLVQRVATDILRDAGEAEDLTQDVFFEVYRKAHLYDPSRGSVRVWLLQYAYHRSLRRKDALRRRASYRGEPLDELERWPHEHRRQLTRQECRWIVRAGLAHLPERQRTTLELVCLEELTLRDVAERLSVTLGCARHYYYRGLSRLRAWAMLAGKSQASASRARAILEDTLPDAAPTDGKSRMPRATPQRSPSSNSRRRSGYSLPRVGGSS
jgi:RNA polymerase sigma-70 factor (ECF subfamily)